MQIFAHLLAVRLNALAAVDAEGAHGIREETSGLQVVIDHDRHEHVQLKITLACRKADRTVVCHDLNRDHRDGFALGRIYLAGHNRGAGLILRNVDFAEAAAGAGREPADVVCNLHEIGRESLQCTVGVDQFRLGGQRVILIFRRAEGLAGELGDSLCGLCVKALRCV